MNGRVSHVFLFDDSSRASRPSAVVVRPDVNTAVSLSHMTRAPSSVLLLLYFDLNYMMAFLFWPTV